MYQPSKKPVIKILLASILSLNATAFAGQLLTPKGDDTLVAQVSRSEPTHIRLEGQKIRRVFGSESDFAIVPDAESGSAYIRPTTDSSAFGIYVADHGGNTYKLLLSVVNGPSDPIVIKALPAKSTVKAKRINREMPRQQAIKNMIIALEADDSLGMDAQQTNTIVPLWNEAMFIKKKIIDNGEIKGERFVLTNTSLQPMIIDEREFFHRRIQAVSVDRPNLLPGESTTVDIVAESDND